MSSVEGQQDTSYWEQYDATAFEEADNTANSEAEYFDLLASVLSNRRRQGPLTRSLAYNYHTFARQLRIPRPELALTYIDTALAMKTEIGDIKRDIAQSYYAKGRILTRLGNHQRALRTYNLALRLMDEAFTEQDSIPDLARRLAYFYVEAARSARENGNYALANLRLKQIPPLSEIYDNPQTTYSAELIQADVYSDLGAHQAAVTACQRLEAMPYYSTAYIDDQAALHHNKGIFYNRMNRASEAEVSLRKAIALNSEANNKQNLSFTQSSLVRSLNLQGRYAEAEAEFLACLSTLEGVYANGKAPVWGEIYARAAITQSLQNNFTRADSLLRLSVIGLMAEPAFQGPADLPVIEGATIYGQEDMWEMLTSKRDMLIRAYEQNARPDGLELALATCHTIDTLLRYNRSQLSLTSSLGQLIRLEAGEYTQAVDLALRLYRTTGEQRYLEEAYQFVSGQKSNLLQRYLISPNLAENMGVPKELIEKKSDLEIKVLMMEEALAEAGAADKPALRDSLLRLNAIADDLRRQLEVEYPAFTRALRGFPPIAAAEAAATMEENQLIIEYFLSADSIYTFTLSKRDGVSVIIVPRPDNLTELIGTVVNQGAGATALYELLVAPLLAGKPAITRLQFIPDGDLWKIPFAALKRGEDFLIQDYAISFAYAAPLLFDRQLADRARARELEYLGYGISYENLQRGLTGSGLRSADYRDLRAMGQLPFASKEVQRAAELMGGLPRLDHEASLTNFLRESAGANILHLSMHGLLRPNPMESALVFTGDGEEEFALLEMKDVLGGNYPSELTVLSACHTGGGTLQTSEGMQSIGRAFTAAGSRSTITSTWAARDESTHDILGRFFEELKGGAAKDIALQRAIKEYLAAGTAADRRPDHWANLTLTGVVTPIDEKMPWWPIGVAGVAFLVGCAFGMRRLTTNT